MILQFSSTSSMKVPNSDLPTKQTRSCPGRNLGLKQNIIPTNKTLQRANSLHTSWLLAPSTLVPTLSKLVILFLFCSERNLEFKLKSGGRSKFVPLLIAKETLFYQLNKVRFSLIPPMHHFSVSAPFFVFLSQPITLLLLEFVLSL